MASFAIPFSEFDSVELKATSFSDALEDTHRTFVTLSDRLRQGIEIDESILAKCTDPRIESLSSKELEELAARLERLVETRTVQLSKMDKMPFHLPEVMQMQEQVERLKSLAETFRMGANPANRTAGSELVKDAASEAAKGAPTTWRELVGSLHD